MLLLVPCFLTCRARGQGEPVCLTRAPPGSHMSCSWTGKRSPARPGAWQGAELQAVPRATGRARIEQAAVISVSGDRTGTASWAGRGALRTRVEREDTWGGISALPVTNLVTLGRRLDPCGPRFPQLGNGGVAKQWGVGGCEQMRRAA